MFSFYRPWSLHRVSKQLFSAGIIFNSTTAVLLLLILATGAGSVSAAVSSQNAAAETAAGWTHFERQNWEQAEAAFRRAVEADPGSAEAWRGLAETLLAAGDLSGLAAAAAEAVPHLSGNPRSLLSLGEILSRDNATRDQAIDIYRLVLEMDPDNDSMRLDLARNLAWSGRRREAIEECRKLRDTTEDPEFRYQAGLLEAQAQSWRGNQKEAIRLYLELNETRPGDPDLRLGIADSHAWSGYGNRALAEYAAMLDDHSSPDAWVGMGDIKRWSGNFEEAGDDYREALDLRPGHNRAIAGLEGIERDTSPRISFVPGRFRDSTDWERDSAALFVDLMRARPVSLRAGAARIRYEEGSGRQIYRTALPVQATVRGRRGFVGEGGLTFSQYGDGTDTTSFFLRGGFGSGDRIRYRAGFDHYDIIDDFDPLRENYYNIAETIDVVPLEIDLDELRGGLFVRFSGRLTWDSDLAYGDISDGNERWTGFSRLAYRIPARDQVRLFGQLFYQNTSERTPLYFDPSNFQSWGLGALWTGERAGYFRFLLEGTIGFHPNEEDLLGGQVLAWAEWDLANHLSLRVIGNFLTSPQERGQIAGENYDATYFGLRFVGRIPPRRAAAAPGNGS
jgi:tetratricopeptide (TPR) repeat protein